MNGLISINKYATGLYLRFIASVMNRYFIVNIDQTFKNNNTINSGLVLNTIAGHTAQIETNLFFLFLFFFPMFKIIPGSSSTLKIQNKNYYIQLTTCRMNLQFDTKYNT